MMRNFINQTLIFLTVILIFPFQLKAQVGINNSKNTPDPSAILDVQSFDKGVLMPRMTTSERDAIVNPAEGLMIYNLDDSCFNYFSRNVWFLDCGIARSEPEFPPIAVNGGANIRSNDIVTDEIGNSYITGHFYGTASFGNTTLTSSGGSDMFAAKVDLSGKFQWVISGGGSIIDAGYGISMDDAGNIYVTGSFQGSANFGNTSLTSSGGQDVFITKINSSGQYDWAVKAGGSNDAVGRGIANDASGNSYIVGYFNGTANFGSNSLTSNGSVDAFITKVSSSGQILWAERGGGNSFDYGNGISVDAAGNSFVTGNFSGTASFGSSSLTSQGTLSMFVAKYNSAGQLQWVVQGDSDFQISAENIVAAAGGNHYIIGIFYGVAYLGNTTISTGSDIQVFVTKITPSGQFLWGSSIGGSGLNNNETGTDITVDPDGKIYITGYYTGAIELGSETLPSKGAADIFVAKLNSQGQVEWGMNAGGTKTDYGLGISVDTSQRVFVTGFHKETAEFGNNKLISGGGEDAFVWVFSSVNGENFTNPNFSKVVDLDTSSTNEIQTLNGSGTLISISKANSVNLASIFSDNQKIDKFSLNGTVLELSLEDDGQADLTVDLASIDTDKDEQSLSRSGKNLSLTNGGSVNINNVVNGNNGLTYNSSAQRFQLGGTLIKNTTINQGNYTMNFNTSKQHGFSVDGNTFSVDGANDRVGIGTSNPIAKLHIAGDIYAFNGVFAAGVNSNDFYGSNTIVSHIWYDAPNSGWHMVALDSYKSTGDAELYVDEVHMPDNIVHIENQGITGGLNHDIWVDGSDYTPWMDVKPGNVLTATYTLAARLESGYYNDDFYFRIAIDGNGGCSDSFTEELFYRPDEANYNHNYHKPVTYSDVIPINCTGQMRFKIHIKNTGDDLFEIRDRSLSVVKF